MSFENLLDSKCTIKQETLGAIDGMGGHAASTWGTLYLNVCCRFESLPKVEEILAHDKKTTYPDYYVYLVYRSGIKEGMRIYHNSRQFEIKLVENWSEQEKYLQLAVTELTRK
jgi:SPP1 family predicted phage head-tail adaptor